MQKIVNLRNNWKHYNSVSTIGYAYIGNTLLQHEEFSRVLSDKSVSEILSFLTEANGFFAIIKDTAEGLIAAVDRIRSIPLFYAVEGDRVFISDDAYWISEQLSCDHYDYTSMIEFVSMGFVTGADTLFPKIKQIKAGELIYFKNVNEEIHVETKLYYRFLHHDYSNEPEEILQKKLDEVVISTFNRMIHSLDGRTIVIPLSGGGDSRLIAITLKRLGYENVICFSYGNLNHQESEASCKIAKKLGYQWEFVPYSYGLWDKWYHSDERRDYFRYADNLSSVAHIQDWPAVWEMKKHGIIPKDSVFVPGHGGFIFGNSSLFELVDENISGLEEFAQYVMRRDYRLWNLRRLHNWLNINVPMDKLHQKIKNRIIASIQDLSCNNIEELTNIFEYWHWQETEPKFSGNSVRAYEFWGYDWRLPYWDLEIMNFYEQIPLNLRLGKKLRNDYIELVQKKYDINFPKQPKKQLKRNVKKLLTSINLYKPELIAAIKYLPYKLPLLSHRKRLHAYNNHPLCWYGIVPKDKFLSFYTGREDINTFLTLERLGIISL